MEGRRARNKRSGAGARSALSHWVSSNANFIAQLNAETAPLINDTHTSQRGLISAPGLRIPSLCPLFQIGKLWRERATPPRLVNCLWVCIFLLNFISARRKRGRETDRKRSPNQRYANKKFANVIRQLSYILTAF